MTKWPQKQLYKVKYTLTIDGKKVNGIGWIDRWYENIWFKTSTHLYTPFEFKRLKLDFYEKFNFMTMVIYSEKISNLIPTGIKLLNKIPEQARVSPLTVIPFEAK